MEMNLESIRTKIDQSTMKDIYNMDEADNWIILQVTNGCFLAAKQLEGRKKTLNEKWDFTQ